MSVRPASSITAAESQSWPALPIAEWLPTRDTLHMWTQIVGKIRMDLTPAINHWWHVPLYIGARGLTTGVIPYGARAFEMEFDFIDHALIIQTSDAQQRRIELKPQSVAEFYERVMKTMDELGLPCRIWRMPVEVPAPIPFDALEDFIQFSRNLVFRNTELLEPSRVPRRCLEPHDVAGVDRKNRLERGIEEPAVHGRRRRLQFVNPGGTLSVDDRGQRQETNARGDLRGSHDAPFLGGKCAGVEINDAESLVNV